MDWHSQSQLVIWLSKCIKPLETKFEVIFMQAFQEAHPSRQLVKKWVSDKIKEIAERGIRGWNIKAEMPAPPQLPISSDDHINPDDDLRDTVMAPTSPKTESARLMQDNSNVEENGKQNAINASQDLQIQPQLDRSQHTLFSLLPKVVFGAWFDTLLHRQFSWHHDMCLSLTCVFLDQQKAAICKCGNLHNQRA